MDVKEKLKHWSIYPYNYTGYLTVESLDELMEFVKDMGVECSLSWDKDEPTLEICNEEWLW